MRIKVTVNTRLPAVWLSTLLPFLSCWHDRFVINFQERLTVMLVFFLFFFFFFFVLSSRKHTYIILTPFKRHFYIVKLGFTGIDIIFLISAQKHRLWVLVTTTLPRPGGSKECPQAMFWAEIWKILEFLSENFQALVVKFSIYLNRRVFIMNLILYLVFMSGEASEYKGEVSIDRVKLV